MVVHRCRLSGCPRRTGKHCPCNTGRVGICGSLFSRKRTNVLGGILCCVFTDVLPAIEQNVSASRSHFQLGPRWPGVRIPISSVWSTGRVCTGHVLPDRPNRLDNRTLGLHRIHRYFCLRSNPQVRRRLVIAQTSPPLFAVIIRQPIATR